VNQLQSLHDKRVLSIDLSAIVAGSGIHGQFEERFKALIRDIEDEVCSYFVASLRII
jgi:ATP-dependent Clp protease ATP-binding subunit ClpB